MTQSLRRAVGFALVASLSLSAPVLGRAAAVPFAVVALVAFVVTEGPLFELFAYPWDRQEERLDTLLGFALAATGLGVLVPLFDLPVGVYVATLLAVGYGDLGRVVARRYAPSEVAGATGFATLGFVAAFAGRVVTATLLGEPLLRPEYAFLAASGALLAGLLRAVFTDRDDPLILVSVALLLWLFADLAVAVTWTRVVVALGVTILFGYISYALGAASGAGMLTGVFLALLAVVLGDYGWFAVLVTFFGVGALATKYHYEEKKERGVAEENAGARGSGNVLGNSAAALLALLLFAASPRLPVDGAVFRFAFCASVATALADTLSSEIGGLYGPPRLITTLEEVDPGTDGGVTWQGEVAGLAGAALIALLAWLLLPLSLLGAAVVVVGGFAGMTADSLAGALIEGDVVGNQAVNFLATATGGVVGGLLALALGLV
ncbi:DUF92 domain-containing protein [Halospeciosus flavus]|uniref:DUF92 domain-containing protein n=1 Tax=Halospeciosus flavus TaxID=3032283 RepID=A0ABD5Z8E4_9EURY|nr:DUF92 domain-containing protein [Halospeciosus flavus]